MSNFKTRLLYFLRHEFRFYRVLQPDHPFHAYLLQFLTFFYMAYRLASRNYTVYGLIPSELFTYPRMATNLQGKPPLIHFISFQFVYDFIPHPSPEIIAGLQFLGIFLCVLGIVGIFPRIAALITLFIAIHLTGFMQATNSEIEGGTVIMMALLILVLSPNMNFYRFGKPLNFHEKHPNYRWTIFLLMLTIGCFYTMSGFNKLVDVGPHWPFMLHLENLAVQCLERGLFLSQRSVFPEICVHFQSYPLSVISGWGTLIGEVGFISVLFLPRYRVFLVSTMVMLHILVYLFAGINFIGSSLILILCLDWNILVRHLKVTANQSWLNKWQQRLQNLDWFKLIEYETYENESLLGKDDIDEDYIGVEVWEQIFSRIPLLWILSLLMKIPGVYYILLWQQKNEKSTY